MYHFDVEKETSRCINWLKNWFSLHSGGANGAVLGISGGKDSAVAAGLLLRAIGRNRVLGLLMPNGEEDMTDAQDFCSDMRLRNVTINVCPVYEAALNAVRFGLAYTEITTSPQARLNLLPRIRASVLYAVGQSMGYRVTGTSNRSERFVGYTTKWGDTACDFNPLANFTSDEVVSIGDYLGLPEHIVHKPPSDGLCGMTDEENLGFTYQDLNDYINTRRCKDKDTALLISRLHTWNQHKNRLPDAYVPAELRANL